MKVAITGAAGLFGHGLVQVFGERHTVIALTRSEVDITRAEQVCGVFKELKPDLVIHPAGIPDIDICEADPAKAFLVNYHGMRNVVEAARQIGAGVAYISTDAVFDGTAQTPYVLYRLFVWSGTYEGERGIPAHKNPEARRLCLAS